MAPEKRYPSSSLLSPSGVPAVPIYPLLLGWLKTQGMNDENLTRITHDANARTFGFDLPNTSRRGDMNLAGEYDFDL